MAQLLSNLTCFVVELSVCDGMFEMRVFWRMNWPRDPPNAEKQTHVKVQRLENKRLLLAQVGTQVRQTIQTYINYDVLKKNGG